MLGEAFLTVLSYREDGRITPTAELQPSHTHHQCVDPFIGIPFNYDPHAPSAEPGPTKKALGPTKSLRLTDVSQPVAGLSIPGCSPRLIHDPHLSVGFDTCSLLKNYPDLRLCQETGEQGDSFSPLRTAMEGFNSSTQPSVSGATCHEVYVHPGPQEELRSSSVPNQGYQGNVTTKMDLIGPGLEPMSNSLLNGLLEKQLEEVYLQHLTDSLARCNSHLGNSLLHGLVPPLKVRRLQPQELDSLKTGSAENIGKVISYVNTQNITHCSSNFSSPVLRISETVNAQPQ